MQSIHDGQCGMCTHFGEANANEKEAALMQIRASHQAPENFVEDCGHPKHASLHLRVTPISGCDGFEPAG